MHQHRMKAKYSKIVAVVFLGGVLGTVWWATRRLPPWNYPPQDELSQTVPHLQTSPQENAACVSTATTWTPTSGLESGVKTAGSPVALTPAWVELLLSNGALKIPYTLITAQPVSKETIDRLLRRYAELPALPFTNKMGIAQALAYIGDERVIDLFSQTLFEDCQGLRLSEEDAELIAGLLVLMGHLAARYDCALDFLRPGLEEAYWLSNITWTIEGVSPAGLLVVQTIRGLGFSSREKGMDLLLHKRQTADQGYLRNYAPSIKEAIAWWYIIRQLGRANIPTNAHSQLALLVNWSRTKEGQAWEQWMAEIRAGRQP